MRQYAPEDITKLEPNQIFVFGSNQAGRHGRGAAKTALNKFGARYGVGRGIEGNSYALPTKDFEIQTLSLPEIEEEIRIYLETATWYPELQFFTTLIGCGLACYEPKDIGKLFAKFQIPPNVILPREFWDAIDEINKTK